MKPIITSLLILVTSLAAQARLIRNWSDQELLEKSDLVVIATPTATADTQERTDLPGFRAQHVIGIETGFAVSAVVKGDKGLKNFVLHHYRADGDPSFRGPNFVAFKPEDKRRFLLFLKRETDGRYAPTVGQVDPGMQGITALSDPVSTNPNPAPPVDVAKPTPPSSRALKEPNILAVGAWSEPVAGTRDKNKNTARGAHSPIIRGRLLLCESPKNNSPAVYLELQDCGDTWVTTTEIYCDMNRGIRLEPTDTKDQPLPPIMDRSSGGAPGADWITFPADSTIRLRVSPYASFSYASTDDYLMSGSFVVDNPPADHTGLGVWQGTLKLPAMKITIPHTSPEATRPQDAEHAKWVAGCLKDFESIKVGMTRGEIEGKLSKDGGLQSVSPFRLTHPACATFKIDVEFEFQRNPADQNRALWGKNDKAIKVSKPYLERPAVD